MDAVLTGPTVCTAHSTQAGFKCGSVAERKGLAWALDVLCEQCTRVDKGERVVVLLGKPM